MRVADRIDVLAAGWDRLTRDQQIAALEAATPAAPLPRKSRRTVAAA